MIWHGKTAQIALGCPYYLAIYTKGELKEQVQGASIPVTTMLISTKSEPQFSQEDG